MELWLAIVLEKGKFSLQRVVGKQRSWQRIFPQIITFFVSIKTTTPTTKFFWWTNKITKVLPAASKAIRGGTMYAKYKK